MSLISFSRGWLCRENRLDIHVLAVKTFVSKFVRKFAGVYSPRESVDEKVDGSHVGHDETMQGLNGVFLAEIDFEFLECAADAYLDSDGR